MTAGCPRQQTNGQTAENLVEPRQSVDFWKSSCGHDGLVIMEPGGDYRDVRHLVHTISVEDESSERSLEKEG